MLFFLKPISDDIRPVQERFKYHKRTMMLILVSIFSCVAAILQSAGGFLPGIGYIISPLATAPILLGSILSIPFGVMTYVLTIGLLFILQPTELIIFPFTTGLLGLAVGGAFSILRRRIGIILFGAFLLTLGIASLLYIFRFPILGPIASNSFSVFTTGGILLFSLLYSWLWVEVALAIFQRIKILIG